MKFCENALRLKFPFLSSSQIQTIDFLSLDVEGSELDILQTLPWDKVDIRGQCYKHFYGHKLVFAPGMPFQPSLIVCGQGLEPTL